MMTDPEQLYTFKDFVPDPDPVYDYPSSLRDGQIPVVIDNGRFPVFSIAFMFLKHGSHALVTGINTVY